MRREIARTARARWYLIVMVAVMIGSSAATARAGDEEVQQTSQRRPNIVFLLADDLGYGDVGFMSSKDLRTPNLDKLAAGGARLDQFYVQPLCTPTRAALMTGRYPMRYGLQIDVIRPFSQYGLSLDERTLPQALKDAGYVTAISGKWHLGHFERAYLPTARGFDHQYGPYNGAIDYFTHQRDGGHDWHRDDKANYDKGYATDLIAREAARLIRSFGDDRPFFLYVPFTAPHTPLQVPERYKEPYARLPEPRRTYAGMVAALDEAVGEITAALDERALWDNTLLIFLSDNGGLQPGVISDNGPLKGGKDTADEGGVRVPAAVYWRGHIKPGTVVTQPLHVVDWYPTLLKLAGAPLAQPHPLDGRDAWPTIAHGKPSPHDIILLDTRPESEAIRAGHWKLVMRHKPQGQTLELYDLAEDPSEQKNVAASHRSEAFRLWAQYAALAVQAVRPLGPSQPPTGRKAPKVWGED